MKVTRWTAALSALVLLAPAASALPLRETAKRISSAAREKGAARISILPLEARGSASPLDGEVLAGRLAAQIVKLERVRVVERARLADVLAERRLAEIGAMGASALPAGAAAPSLQAADAVVTGTFARRGETMRVAVRLVHAASGEILAATEEDVPWQDAGPADAGEGAWAVPSGAQLRDAPREEDCSTAAERADRVELGVLDLKARYWAGRLRKGVPPDIQARDPVSTISDPDLKKRFYDAMKEQYDRPEAPDLSPRELERFQRENGRALEILRDCGL